MEEDKQKCGPGLVVQRDTGCYLRKARHDKWLGGLARLVRGDTGCRKDDGRPICKVYVDIVEKGYS